MDIQAQKLELIKWLAEVNDPKLISKFLTLKKQSMPKEDTHISESIERGLKDINDAKTTPHSEVRKKYTQWL